jgi:hypothetical protein
MKKQMCSLVITLVALIMGCIAIGACNGKSRLGGEDYESREDRLLHYRTEMLRIAENTHIEKVSDVSLFLKQTKKVEDEIDALPDVIVSASNEDSLTEAEKATKNRLEKTYQEYTRELWRIVKESAKAGIDPYAFHENPTLFSIAKAEVEIYTEVNRFEDLYSEFIESRNASNEGKSRTVIREINRQYARYIGFLLSEHDSEDLISAAHDKIISSIRREILVKHKNMVTGQNE